MKKLISRSLYLCEVVVLILPITWLFGIYVLVMASSFSILDLFEAEFGELLVVAVFALCGIYLVAAWWVSWEYLFRGVDGLESIRGSWLRVTDFAAASTLGTVALLAISEGRLGDVAPFLFFFLFGLPLLIPYTHILIERRSRDPRERSESGTAQSGR